MGQEKNKGAASGHMRTPTEAAGQGRPWSGCSWVFLEASLHRKSLWGSLFRRRPASGSLFLFLFFTRGGKEGQRTNGGGKFFFDKVIDGQGLCLSLLSPTPNSSGASEWFVSMPTSWSPSSQPSGDPSNCLNQVFPPAR